MCIKRFFMRFRKANAQANEPTQVTTVAPVKTENQKRIRVRKDGEYRPKSENVRIDNVAMAAGVSQQKIRETAKETGIEVYAITGQRGLYVEKCDAVFLHSFVVKTK